MLYDSLLGHRNITVGSNYMYWWLYVDVNTQWEECLYRITREFNLGTSQWKDLGFLLHYM